MKKVKIYLPYVFLFFFFLFLLIMSPICGDDWNNYLVGKDGLYHSIGNAIGMYFDWEGRFVSRIFINILTYHKMLWNIMNSLCLTLLIYYIVKLVGENHKKIIFFLSAFLLLFMNPLMFSQVVVWIAGNITYLFSMVFFLYYLYMVLNLKDEKNTIVVLFMILNTMIPMFIEHIGVLLVLFNLLINVCYYMKYKKLNRRYLVYFFVSVISFSIMFFSPGSLKRAKIENIEFNQLSFFGKMIYNLPNFIYYTFLSNPYMTLLMVMANYYLIKNVTSKKYFKFVGYCYLIVLPTMFSLIYCMSGFSGIHLQSNMLVIIYFLLYMIIECFLIYWCFRKEKKNWKLLFFCLGITVNTVMLISPTWDFRTGFATYILLSISFIMIIDSFLLDTKVKNIVSMFFMGIAMILYLILYVNIYWAQKDLENSIEKQKKENKKVIEILRFPSFINCNINPESDYHILKFKEYYGISNDVEIKLLDSKFHHFIFYR